MTFLNNNASHMLRRSIVGVLLMLALGAPAAAQTTAAFEVARDQVGFPRYDNPNDGAFKSGLWMPIFVTFSRNSRDGNIVLPIDKSGSFEGRLHASVADAEGTQGVYTRPIHISGSLQDLAFPIVTPLPNLGATCATLGQPGTIFPDVSLSLTDSDGNKMMALAARSVQTGHSALPMGGSLYLTIGEKLPSFARAMSGFGGKIDGQDARTVAFLDDDIEWLPENWFGYQSVDLIVLTTHGRGWKSCLIAGARESACQNALDEWVRRGGHLVISVTPEFQAFVQKIPGHRYLGSLLDPEKTVNVTALQRVHQWANSNRPFPPPGVQSLTIPVLHPDKTMQVIIADEHEEKPLPLMVRMPYGLGSVTVVAVDFADDAFAKWEGNQKFWQQLVNELAPRVRAQADNVDAAAPLALQGTGSHDISTQLHRHLDEFDVPAFSFGWVALFILAYLLVVGPLDYFVLKRVFKRLEWTWVTFPAIVIAISVLVYATASAARGDQMRINKIDLVDIDLRTDLDADYQTRQAYAYGASWFSVLSPRNNTYTLRLEPRLDAWGVQKLEQQSLDYGVMLTWMGRPEVDDPIGTGKSRSPGLFRRSYEYAANAAGLDNVPIPVWSTRAFTGTWQARLDRQPFTIDLHYDPKGDAPTAGTIISRLPVALEDVHLFYGNRYYTLKQAIPAGGQGAGQTVRVELDKLKDNGLSNWVAGDAGGPPGDRAAPILRQLFFFDKLPPAAGSSRNHSLRPLDQSWRLGPLPVKDDAVHTAILVGRLARTAGSLQELQARNDPHLPTHLSVSGAGDGAPQAASMLTQTTYIRVLVPVRPAERQ